ncbi:hypothetical protein C8T65DRAFT_696745 [Cerioporus squamosus]|nr:hypothetical protein C8T65DRAFT_696745 [Cerioporus squamosus]
MDEPARGATSLQDANRRTGEEVYRHMLPLVVADDDSPVPPSAVQSRVPPSSLAEVPRAPARALRGEQDISLTEFNVQPSGESQEPTQGTSELSHHSAFSSRMPTDTIHVRHCRHISGSEVAGFTNRFHNIIRELYLPREFRKWQQLVRAGVLTVGLVQELHGEGGYGTGQLQEVLQNSGDVSPTEWISEWLDLQPPTRFQCPKASVEHPSMLLYPAHTVPHEWLLFWTRSGHIVFRTLLGLKRCSPNPSSRAKRYLMDRSEWEAWVNDVLWVLCRLIDLAKFRGRSIFGVPTHLTSAAEALQKSYLHAEVQQTADGSSELGRRWKAVSLQAAPRELSVAIGSSSHKRRAPMGEETRYSSKEKSLEAREEEDGLFAGGEDVKDEDEDRQGYDYRKEGEVTAEESNGENANSEDDE